MVLTFLNQYNNNVTPAYIIFIITYQIDYIIDLSCLSVSWDQVEQKRLYATLLFVIEKNILTLGNTLA